jgi:hypothetical protein
MIRGFSRFIQEGIPMSGTIAPIATLKPETTGLFPVPIAIHIPKLKRITGTGMSMDISTTASTAMPAIQREVARVLLITVQPISL